MCVQKGIALSGYVSDGFIGSYQKLITDTVIPYQYDILNDKKEGAEKSHAVQNFINAADVLKGGDGNDGFYGMVFQDSDVGKWIEAAAYSLINSPDKELEAAADRLIDIIAAAQDTDGYLNTRFTVTDKDKRWTNLLEAHELYCAGHLMEGACAYYEAVGKDKFLKVMLKNAEHIYRHFITEGHEGYPGHPEIELALMRMYRTTGDSRCLELAKHFIDTRGVDPYFYVKEKEKRNWTVWGNDPYNFDYQQNGMPVRELSDATGHAVRAVYLYTGMADLAAQTRDTELFAACRRLWESITGKRMYITGGIGTTVQGEAFTADYDLPPDTAYAETCASVGLMFFAAKMLGNEINGEYADIMERAFYNTVLAGMQLDGKRFFYVNPLECVPGISGVSPTHRHDLTARPGWYACACCPPNAARLIGSFGKYAYGENKDTAFCHLYAGGTVSFENGVRLECKTAFPYGFDVDYNIISGGRIAVRIPSWSRDFSLTLNGEKIKAVPEKGYVYLDTRKGDRITLRLDDSVRVIYPSPKIASLSGRAALMRGALVYCFEGVDNDGDVLSLSLAEKGEAVPCRAEGLPEEVTALSVECLRSSDSGSLYTDVPPTLTKIKATAVPYHTWANRGENQMRVFIGR